MAKQIVGYNRTGPKIDRDSFHAPHFVKWSLMQTAATAMGLEYLLLIWHHPARTRKPANCNLVSVNFPGNAALIAAAASKTKDSCTLADDGVNLQEVFWGASGRSNGAGIGLAWRKQPPARTGTCAARFSPSRCSQPATQSGTRAPPGEVPRPRHPPSSLWLPVQAPAAKWPPRPSGPGRAW